jgi:FKBP-type peptidyl-prolyl cis-trans isomerase FkpA
MRTARIFFLALVSLAAIPACSKVEEPGQQSFKPAQGTPESTEFVSIDEVVGTGKEAKEGSKVKVHYTGTLTNGTKFDSSRDKGTPFEFTIGAGNVIKGWDKGVVGMKVGGKRKLEIPSSLAYGDEGRPPTIPKKARLKFDIELLAVD